MHGMGFERILGGVCAPQGFLASGVSCGIKSDSKLDLALVFSEFESEAAGVFTTNDVIAAPVIVSKRRILNGIARAVVVNSGNANSMTGERGISDAELMLKATEEALGIEEGQALVASTGVIGEYLPMENVLQGIEDAVSELSTGGNTDAAKAIMTTDTYPKELACEMEIGGKIVRIGAMAKGSGMIHPNLATMICIITTDAPIASHTLSDWLKTAVEWSFNRISVDGDMSTNDCVFMLANGAAFPQEYEFSSDEEKLFFRALCWLCGYLSMAIVKDGEGATKLIRIVVNGTRNDAEAVTIARTIANSSLVKCSLNGGIPNWGRIAAALGSARTGIEPDKIEIFFGEQKVASSGIPHPFDIEELRKYLARDEVEITVNLGIGNGSAYFLTTDLSKKYVELNAREKT